MTELHAIAAKRAELRRLNGDRPSTATPAVEPVAYTPVWQVAQRLGVSVAGATGEISLAAIDVIELADYPGIRVIRQRDADRLYRRLQERQGQRR
jgi:hypothetical protein